MAAASRTAERRAGMSRYIDADALKSQKEYCEERHEYVGPVAKIDWTPTVDAVGVVRCRECKHCRNLPNGLCYLHTEPSCNERGYKGEAVCVEPDDFCSYGEREETK